LYEGRTTEAEVRGGGRLDALFPDMFRGRTAEELEAIQRRYATRGDVMEAPALLAAKARDMLRHYVDNVLPNGFKAQVVAVTRRAAVRYREAFLMARHELVAELEMLDPSLLSLPVEEAAKLPPDVAFLARAHAHLPLLREIEFAPVISGDNDDGPDWKPWTDEARTRDRVRRFKLPFVHEDPKKRDPLAFLIVKSMLLTGFDAPIEQAMYLDRRVVEAELLQAIARVNRTAGAKKRAGLVVDYYGVGTHLGDALAAYGAEDVEGALRSLKDELPKLAEQHRAAVEVLTSRGLTLTDTQACLDLLRDPAVRTDLRTKLKRFLATLDLVLPRPEALPFLADARALAFLQHRARNLYREPTRPLGRDVGEKIRRLIDDHLVSLGVIPGIPPVSLTDPAFRELVARAGSPRGEAGELEQALRNHIDKHAGEDPNRYGALSERLERILAELEGRWEAMAEALQKLADEMRGGRAVDDSGLDPETEAPFLDTITSAIAGDDSLDAETTKLLARQVKDLVAHVRQEVRLPSFWKNPTAQDTLHKWIAQFLDRDPGTGAELIPFEKQPEVADQLLELARRNHAKLVR
jgi:type I restriction enzyme R subunit